MKNKFIKAIFVSFLCLIIFTGCSVGPSSTPDIIPTPEVTPIPYGEILDLNVFLLAEEIERLPSVVHLQDVLLNRFSLRMNYVKTVEDADIVFNGLNSAFEFAHVFLDDSKSIDLIDRIDKLPNLTTLYDTISYTVWAYNEEWFENNGYDIPKKMDNLILSLVDYKSKHPNEKPILGHSNTDDEYSYTERAIGLTYGIDLMDKEAESNGKYSKAVNAVKTVRENDLIEYNYSSGKDLNNYAVMYTDSYRLTTSYCDNWRLFDNQLSDEENEIYASQRRYGSNIIMNNYIGDFYLRDNNNPKVIERIMDYLNWCCSEEGVLCSYFGVEGESYTTDENGLICDVGVTSGHIGAAVRMVSPNFARRYILPKYCSESVIKEGAFDYYDGRIEYEIFKIFDGKNPTVIQLKPLIEKTDPKNKELFYITCFDNEIYDLVTKK